MSRRLKLQFALLPLIILIQRLLRPISLWQLPPKFLRRLVGGRVNDDDFMGGASALLETIVTDTHLKKESQVLDIGCGCGAAALAFSKYLSARGRYEAFDIVPQFIYWCQHQIADFDHRFNFRLVDIFNQQYNPTGLQKAKEYRFMCPDNHFDLVFAWSVYTHLLEADFKHYLSESARVLKPGGYLWISLFLLRNQSRQAIKAKKSVLDFSLKVGQYSWSTQKDIPEVAMAYDEQAIHQWLESNHLKLVKTRYGTWPEKSDLVKLQDIIIAQKL